MIAAAIGARTKRLRIGTNLMVLPLHDPKRIAEDAATLSLLTGGRFVAGGTIAPGGALPVNTNGGGLSCAHPGMYGLLAITEAVRQLRGEAASQIEGAEAALAHGNGGTLSSQSSVILGRSS